MQKITVVEDARVRVVDANVAGAMPGQVHHLQFQTAAIQRIAILHVDIDLDRKVPVLADNLGVGKAETFALAQIEILQHLLGGRAEACDVLAPRDDQRVLDDRLVERMGHDLCTVALLEHLGVAGVVVVEMGNDDVF